MELKEGMYVRTNEGKITKIIEIDKNGFERFDKIVDFTNYEIIKASYNIIDLIEVGDYVNDSKVYYCYCADEDSTGLFIDTEKGRQWLDKPSQVKSIVTKEQFESIEYSLEG